MSSFFRVSKCFFSYMIALSCAHDFLTNSLVWTALDPLQYTRVTIGRSEDGTLQSVGNCVSSGKTSTIIASLLFAVNLVVVVFAIIQVYQTRRITVAYHESKVSVYKFIWYVKCTDTESNSNYIDTSLLFYTQKFISFAFAR